MKKKALNFFKKAFTTFFLLVYSFTPSVQAIDEIVSMDDSQDILEEGISDPAWIANGDVYTISDIVEGETYIAPQNSDVTVTFTKLPQDPSTLSIREITLTEEEIEATGAVSNKAYDITTDMEDGTFEYDLTLPSSVDNANVVYAETRDDIVENDVKKIENTVVDNGDTLKVEDLNHFTIYIVVPDDTINDNSVENEDNGWVSDNAYAVFNNSSDYAVYSFPDISIPSGSTIDGIEVLVEGYRTGGSGLNRRYLAASLWNESDNSYTSTKQANLPSSENTITLGSSSDTWNTTWNYSDIVSSDFKIKINATGNSSSGTAYLDSVQVNVHYTEPVASVSNPALTQSCGLDIALVIDISSSIDAGELSQMKSAMISFVDSLEGTPTQFSVTKFGTNATVVQAFTSDFDAVRTKINDIGVGINQGTNWEEAISTATSTFDPRTDKPDLMIFASDGNPTYPYGSGYQTTQADVDAAVVVANTAKSAGIRILALGIGDGLNVNNLKAISGNTVDGTNLLTTDVITTDFSTMSAQLAEFASQTCGGTISVNKYLEDKTTTGGANWIFTLSGASSKTLTTDINGQANTGKITTGTYTIVESLISGYSYLSAECKDQDGNIVGTSTVNGIQNISVNDSDIITCDFINTAVCVAGQHSLEGQVKGGSYTTGNLCSGSGDCWSEGENVPARLTIDGLLAGRQYSVVLEHDYKDSNGKIGYENFNSFSATGASGLTVSDSIYTTDDSTAQYTVSFTATSSTVVLDWNALLSEEAGQWNGASLHYRLVTGACGGAGNKDIPINPGKIVILGSFTPIKSTENGADPSDWTFNLSGLTNVNGILSGETASDLSLSANNGDATYTITETGLSGWELVSVSSPCFVDGSSIKVTLTKSNPDVSCTFVNRLKTGKIVVDKVTNPSGNSQSFSFTTSGTGYNSFSLKDTDSPNEQVLVPGAYTVFENSVSGWTNTSVVCVSSIGDAETIGNLELDNGETITCTFTNTKYASLTIVKDANPDSSQDFSFITAGSGLSDFSLDDDIDPILSNTKVFTNLLPGTYSVAETAVSGWDSSAVCSDGSSNTIINLSAGENVTCTFTNVMRGAIGGHKYNDADGDINTTGDRTGVAGWTIELWQGDSKLNTTVTSGSNGTYAFANLVPGTYQLRESLQLGWYTLYPASYDDYISVTITPGQNSFSNDFINVQYASVTIFKNVDTDGDGDIDVTNSNTWTWDLNGKGDNPTGSIMSRLQAGTYTFSEDHKDGYHVISLICNNGIGGADNNYGAVESQSISVSSGQNLVCTFTNARDAGTLKIVKVLTNDNGGALNKEDFSFKINDGLDKYFEADGINEYIVPIGRYSVVENSANGYTTSYNNCENVEVTNGNTTICTITNNDIAPSLTLNKIVVNDNGGNAVASDWTLTATGPTIISGDGTVSSDGTFDAGTYTLSESSLVTGYTAGNWSCIKNGNPAAEGSTITLGLGDTAVCTITNNDIAPTITLTKAVINNNGGSAGVDDFGLTVGGSLVTSGQTVSASANTPIVLNEVGLAGYSFVSITGDDKCPAVLGGAVTLNEGENVSCTITNDDQAGTLIVRKVLIKDNGGSESLTDFKYKINDGVETAFEADGENSSSVNAGTYTITEVTAEGYTTSYSNCANVVVSNGETETCTITNDDIAPTIKLIKSVTNNNGGTAGVDDFGLTVGGTPVISEQTLSVLANTPITIDETGLAGYSFVSITGDDKCPAVLEGTVTLDEGEDITCTITNDDIAPQLTLNKVLVKDNGGNESESDWTLTADGGELGKIEGVGASGNDDVVSGLDFKAGTYILSENSTKGGYNSGAWSCVKNGGSAVEGSSITLGLGDTAICTITNDDIVPTLTVVKNVVNDNGGNAVVGDFGIKLNGGLLTFDSGTTVGNTTTYTSAPSVVSNTEYILSENDLDGYAEGTWNCKDTMTDVELSNTFSLNEGQSVICTITNNDIAPQLTIVKTVVNDNGGKKNVSDFHLYIDGTSATSGTAYEVEANKEIIVSEDAVSGYTPSVWGGDCSVDGKITLLPGESKTCTITNDDQPGTLIVKKILVKDNGGNESVTDFGFRVNGGTRKAFESDGENVLTVNAGRYTVTETPVNGYTTSYNGCTDVRVSNGETKICTITNNDIAPSIKLNKLVINNNGGTAGVNRFGLTIGSTSVRSGQKLNVNANESVAINETGLYGYTFVSITGDDKCPEVLGGTVKLNEGESITCNITNDDIAPKLTLNKVLVNNNGGNAVESDWLLKAVSLSGKLQGYGASGDNDVVSGSTFKADTYILSELGASGYSASGWSCVKNGGLAVEGNLISLSVGDEAVCTITNDDIAPTLRVIKRVVNNNGGNDEIEDFGIKLNDDQLTFDSGVKIGNLTIYTANPTVESNSEYVLSENDLTGYAEGNWYCIDERLRVVSNPFTLNEGQDVVCRIRNNDIAPTLTVVKEVVNDNGGNAVVDDFNIKLGENVLSFDSGITDGDVTRYTSTPVVMSNTEYTLSEDTIKGYTNGIWNCVDNDTLEIVSDPLYLDEGQNITCTIRNDDVAPKLTLVKEFGEGYEGTTLPDDFDLTVGGSIVLSGVSNEYDANTAYSIDETQLKGFVFSSISGDEKCPEVLGETITFDEGDDIICTITNDVINPVLQIEKENNTGGMDKSAGDNVVYTITVTAPEVEEDGGDYVIKDAELRDILPKGFSFVSGSWTATKNGLAISLTEPVYGSTFAVWNLGDIVEGDVIVLSYTGNISVDQDAGLYKDYAWVRGTSLSGDTVLGNKDTGIFVGTKVNVVENYIEEGQVLGITDHVTLPDTGADTILTLAGILSMIIGLFMLLFKSKKKFLMSVMVISLLGLSSTFIFADKFLADIEQPASPVNTQNFEIGFVVANTSGEDITVECIEKTQNIIFGTYTGVNTGNCIVNSSVVPIDGTYTFYISATDNSGTVYSDEVTVTADFVKPSAIEDYEKTESGCSNVLTFKTADDGQTTKVQIFRSTNSSFTANSSTLIKELTVGPNENVTYTDDTAVCGTTYYYAVRALDNADNPSAFVSDKVVVYIEAEDTEETSGTGEVAGEETSEEEEAENTEGESNTEVENTEEEDTNGEVKGETTDETETEKSKGWSWWQYIILSAGVVVLVYVIYTYVKSRRQKGSF